MWIPLTAQEIRAIVHYVGLLMLGLAVVLTVPLLTALGWREWGPFLDYGVGIGVALALGVVFTSVDASRPRLGRRQAFIVSALAWIVASFVGAIPLALSGNYGGYIDALFDTLSGFTTSGLTLAQDLDHMAYAHNMWRHLTQLIGGQGIIVAAISLAIGQKGGSVSLYLAEARDERVLPNVLNTARFIWLVTLAWVGMGTMALLLTNLHLGMAPDRSLLHAFWITVAAYDTGGFGPQSMNTLHYHSPLLEGVTVMLMLAGTMNFSLHAEVWRRGHKELFKNIEVRTLFGNMAILAAFAAAGTAAAGYFTSDVELLRKSLYHVISANSGTGHQTLYATQWPEMGPEAYFAIILAMAFGGMASSTAGGIKALRIGIILKSVVLEVRRALSPAAAVVRSKYHHLAERRLTPEMTSSALTIFALYMVTYMTGGLLGAAYGYPLEDALFESISATANVGLTSGITAPTMPLFLKIVYMAQMLAGRLEFLALLALVFAVVSTIVPRRRRG
jgi:trk system potassium uptake protein TrkH